jgi:hypothetical protein
VNAAEASVLHTRLQRKEMVTFFEKPAPKVRAIIDQRQTLHLPFLHRLVRFHLLEIERRQSERK